MSDLIKSVSNFVLTRRELTSGHRQKLGDTTIARFSGDILLTGYS